MISIYFFFFPGPEYVIHNLSFESTYSIRAAAYNDVGYSDYSEEITKRTKSLVAETVVDGSSMSSSLNSALPSTPNIHGYHRKVALLVLCVIVFTFRWKLCRCIPPFVTSSVRPRSVWFEHQPMNKAFFAFQLQCYVIAAFDVIGWLSCAQLTYKDNACI